MWVRLDTNLIDHRKLFAAGDAIGRNGPGLALAVYTLGLLWSNKHLSDGHVPLEVVKSFRQHVADPMAVADALVQANLWETNGGAGFLIHDYAEYGNPSADEVKAFRQRERDRKRRARARGWGR